VFLHIFDDVVCAVKVVASFFLQGTTVRTFEIEMQCAVYVCLLQIQ